MLETLNPRLMTSVGYWNGEGNACSCHCSLASSIYFVFFFDDNFKDIVGLGYDI